MPSLRQLTELLSLARAVTRPRGAIHIVVAGRQRDWAIDELRSRAPDGLAVHVVEHARALGGFHEPGHVVIVPLTEPAGRGRSLARKLNVYRENLVGESRHAVVMVDDEAALVRLQEVAPDLWSFRHRSYLLHAVESEEDDDRRRRARLRATLIDRMAAASKSTAIALAALAGEVVDVLGAEEIWEHAGLWLDDGRDVGRFDGLARYVCGEAAAVVEPAMWQAALDAVRRRFTLDPTGPGFVDDLPAPSWRSDHPVGGEAAIAAVSAEVARSRTAWITGGDTEARATLASAAGLVLRSAYEGVVTLDGREGLAEAIDDWLTSAGQSGTSAGLSEASTRLHTALGRRKTLLLLLETEPRVVTELRRRLSSSCFIATHPSVSVEASWTDGDLVVGAVLADVLRVLMTARAALSPDDARATALSEDIVQVKRRMRWGPVHNIGEVLGDRYQLIDVIGSGGFATVWRAEDLRSTRQVAVKVLHGQFARDASRRERFFRGARRMMHIQHPAIVRVLDEPQEDGGFYFYVMEHLGGGDLHRSVVQGRLGSSDIIPIIVRVGEALSVAHAQGLVHRDLKPSNILLDEHGMPKLTDFDLVWARDTTGGTRTGAMGTVIYAAPEQNLDAATVDHRVDVYGLAMTAVFGFHGGPLPMKALYSRDHFLAALDVDEGVKEVLLAALRLEPERRTATVAEFCEALKAAGDLAVLDEAPTHRDLSPAG